MKLFESGDDMDKQFVIEGGDFVYYLAFQIKREISYDKIHKILNNSIYIINTLTEEKTSFEADSLRINSWKPSYIEYLTKRADIAQAAAKRIFSEFKFDEKASEQENFVNLVSYIDENSKDFPGYILDFLYKDYKNGDPVSFGFIDRDRLQDCTTECLKEIINYNNNLNAVAGPPITRNKRTFILFPIKLRYKSCASIYVEVTLDIFSNNMAVIKTTIPFSNEMLEQVQNRSLIDVFDVFEVEDNAEMDYKKTSTNNVSQILHSLVTNIFGKYIEDRMCISFEHVVLSDYSPLLTSFSCASKDIKRKIFSIINNDQYDSDISDRAISDFWENNGFCINGCHYFFETSGRCISLISSQFDLYSEIQENDNKVDLISALLDNSIDLFITICMLYRLNSSSVYRLAYGNLNSLLKAKTNYLENENYLDDIFDMTSTSTIKNFGIMKSELSDYIGVGNIKTRWERIENVYLIKKETAKNKISTLISISIYLLTVVFSLPYIRDTLKILRSALPIDNVPLLTTDNLSVAVWVLSGLALLYLLLNISFENTLKKVKSWWD